MDNKEKPIDLLWTGGWDSTFRVLQLVLIDKVKVRTHYIIDPYCFSIRNELQAIKRIKETLREKYPHTRDILLPTEYAAIIDIKPDEKITSAYNRLVLSRHLGSQYKWLARYCKERGIDNIEVGFEKGSGAGASIQKNFMGKITSGNHSGKPRYDYFNLMTPHTEAGKTLLRFDEKKCSKDEYALFKYFSTSIADVTKTDMKRIAEEKGWIDLMNLTWFCHSPLFGNIPCGRCNPCTDAIQRGMSYRVPLMGILMNIIIKLLGLRKLKKLLLRKPSDTPTA